jgi:RecG-like helicase
MREKRGGFKKLMLDSLITVIPKLGKARAEKYSRLGIFSCRDLLYHLPRTYTDFSVTTPIAAAPDTETVTVKGRVTGFPKPGMTRGGRMLYRISVADDFDDQMTVTVFSEYALSAVRREQSYLFRGKVESSDFGFSMFGAEIVELDAPPLRASYPKTQGLTDNVISQNVRYVIDNLDEDDLKEFDLIPVDVMLKEDLVSGHIAVEQIHFPESTKQAEQAKRRLCFEELFILQLGLQKLREDTLIKTTAVCENADTAEFVQSLPFTLTAAQNRVMGEITADLTSGISSNRLVQGDVGSGKTVVAACGAYLLAKNKIQTAVMAPTEVLARQHYETFSKLLSPLGITVTLLTGKQTNLQKQIARDKAEQSETDILVGTHALFQDSVHFANLGLVITDEQHRFGIKQRGRLIDKGENPHVIAMSATPIPRTLALLVYSDMSLSVIDELPKNRQEIETLYIGPDKRVRSFGFVENQLAEGRQAFFVCPLIGDGLEVGDDEHSVLAYAKSIERHFPQRKIAVMHGRLSSEAKQQVMSDFANGDIDIMVSTTVIEVGIDVPNAAVMLIEDAERFGLSQLHQLRGRVGRGEHKSFCILLSSASTDTAKERLFTMVNVSDGFEISEIDLRFRGPGDFFGSRQSGLPKLRAADLSFDMSLLNRIRGYAGQIIDDDSLTPAQDDAIGMLFGRLQADIRA